MPKKEFTLVCTICWLIGIVQFYSSAEAAISGKLKEEFLKDSPEYFNTKDDSLESLFFKFSSVYRSKGRGELKLLSEGNILHSGDLYKIIFTPSVDCFVYIFQVDDAGKIFQLFPMKSFGGVMVNNFNPVQKEKTYYLPAEGKSFQLDEQTGTEKIYFLASRERDLDLEELYQKAAEAQQQPKNELETQLVELDRLLEQAESIQGALSPQNDTETISWKEDGENFTVLQERLENMCDGCMYILTFEHH